MEHNDKHHTVMENIEQLVICPLCKRRFNNPKILPCGHSFCCQCLEHVLIHDGQNLRSCPIPTCERKFILPGNNVIHLPQSTVIQNLIKICQRNEDQNKLCNVHKKRPSVTLCIDCNKLMCLSCTESHRTIMVHHKLLPTDKRENTAIKAVLDSNNGSKRCEAHPDKYVKYYCKTCDIIYCPRCGYHTEHDTELICTFAGYARKQLQMYIDEQGPIISQIKTRIEEYKRTKMTLEPQLESSLQALHTFSEYLQNQIRQKAEALEEQLKQNFASHKRWLLLAIKRLEDEGPTRNTFMNDISASMNYSNAVQIVRGFSSFEKRYKDIAAISLDVPNSKPMLQFTPSSAQPITSFVIGSICGKQPLIRDIDYQCRRSNYDNDNQSATK